MLLVSAKSLPNASTRFRQMSELADMKMYLCTLTRSVKVDINGEAVTIKMDNFDIEPVDVSEVNRAHRKGDDNKWQHVLPCRHE